MKRIQSRFCRFLAVAAAVWAVLSGGEFRAAAQVSIMEPRPPVLGIIDGMSQDAQGRLYVAGRLASVGAQSNLALVRYLPDGSLDTSFNVTVGSGRIICVLARDSKVFVGGSFIGLNGSSGLEGIARLLEDGSIDPSFKPPKIRNSFQATANSLNILAPDAHGGVMLGGGFSIVGVTPYIRFCRLDALGALRHPSPLQIRPQLNGEGPVTLLELMPGGRAVVGGSFASVNAAPRKTIAEFDEEGVLTGRFGWMTNLPFTTWPASAEFAPDDSVIREGAVNLQGGHYPLMAKHIPEGPLAPGFQSITASGNRPANVTGAYLQPDGRLVVAGLFRLEGQDLTHQLLRLNPDGSLDDSFPSTPLPIAAGVGVSSIKFVLQGGGRLAVGVGYSSTFPTLASLFFVDAGADSARPRLHLLPGSPGQVELRYRTRSGAEKWIAQSTATMDGVWLDVATPDQPDKHGSATIDTAQLPAPAYFRLRRADAP